MLTQPVFISYQYTTKIQLTITDLALSRGVFCIALGAG